MRIIISEFISLDGVVQAPGGKDEDTDGGFQHGGWSMPFFDVDAMGPASGWTNTTLLAGGQADAIEAIRDLRATGGDAGLQVMGSASLARQLVENDLVDEYRLMIEPVLLGGGKTIYPADGDARRLELVSVTQAKTGVLICAYRPVAASGA